MRLLPLVLTAVSSIALTGCIVEREHDRRPPPPQEYGRPPPPPEYRRAPPGYDDRLAPPYGRRE